MVAVLGVLDDLCQQEPARGAADSVNPAELTAEPRSADQQGASAPVHKGGLVDGRAPSCCRVGEAAAVQRVLKGGECPARAACLRCPG